MPYSALHPAFANTDDEIRAEEQQLGKADVDIDAGRQRLESQQQLIAYLAASGKDTALAERLAALLQDTLAEWQQHRTLMAQRLAYLQERRRREAQS